MDKHYTPARIRFYLHRWELLDGGKLPKFREEIGIPQHPQPGPAAFERAAVIKADLEKAIGQLDWRMAEAVKIYIIEKQSPEKVADILHCKLTHVFTLASKGVQQMSDYLEGNPAKYRRLRRKISG